MTKAISSTPSFLKTIIVTGFIAGTLDIIAACTSYYISTGKDPLNVLHFVAAGLFGKSASDGSINMKLAGLLIHFAIAFSFTIFYFLIVARSAFVKRSWLVSGILYGLFTWVVMNLLVLPMTKLPPATFKLNKVILGASILVVCIGIPIAYSAHRFYRKKII
jgi:hypothetical protein